MTVSKISEVVAFNLVLFLVGATSLYAMRGLRTWNELIRLAGVAYMLGVALTGIVFVFELVVGLSPSLGVILTTAAVLALAALAVGNQLLNSSMHATADTSGKIRIAGMSKAKAQALADRFS